jgi:uncharacterized membrane protein YcjF (UPF0283 family)
MKNILKTIFLFSFTTILAQVSVVKESPYSSNYLGVPVYPKESVIIELFLVSIMCGIIRLFILQTTIFNRVKADAIH